jgi:hypothetical protein
MDSPVVPPEDRHDDYDRPSCPVCGGALNPQRDSLRCCRCSLMLCLECEGERVETSHPG